MIAVKDFPKETTTLVGAGGKGVMNLCYKKLGLIWNGRSVSTLLTLIVDEVSIYFWVTEFYQCPEISEFNFYISLLLIKTSKPQPGIVLYCIRCRPVNFWRGRGGGDFWSARNFFSCFLETWWAEYFPLLNALLWFVTAFFLFLQPCIFFHLCCMQLFSLDKRSEALAGIFF